MRRGEVSTRRGYVLITPKTRFSTVLALLFLLNILLNTATAQVITNNGVQTTTSTGLIITVGALNNNSGTFTNNGTLTLTSDLTNTGTVSGNGNFNIGGNWTNNGVFNAGNSLVNFMGGALQNITGSNSTTFNNLTLNNTYGVSISLNTSLNGTLVFNNGILTTGSNTLSLGNGANVSGAGAGRYVFGNLSKGIPATTNLSKTFEVGDATVYAPVQIDFIGTPNATGNLTVNTTSGQHPNINTSGINSTKDVARYWTVINNGVTSFTSYNPTFNFVSGDVIGSATPANFHVKRYSGAVWASTTDGIRTNTATQAIGVTAFGDFAVGEICVTPTVIINNLTGTNVLTCATTSINFIATGGNLYLWDNGSTNASRTVSSAGTYSVTVTNTSGGCTATGTIVITTNGSLPTVTAIQNTPITCNSGTTSITVSATGGTTPYTGTGVFTGIGNGIYTYTVTGGNGCSNSTSIVVSQPNLITFTTVNTNASSCGTLGSIAVTATGGSGTKVYSKNNGANFQGASLFSSLSAGTYSVIVRDANGCLSAPSTIVITTNPGITFTMTTVNAATCVGTNGRITVIASGGSGYFNYSKDSGVTYQSSNVFNGLVHGTYKVRVKDVLGCFSGINSAVIGPSCREEEMIPDAPEFGGLNAYPIPADDHITVSFSSYKTAAYNIRLADVFGRIVINDNQTSVIGNNQYQMDLKDIAKGIYFILLTQDEAVLQMKIVLQ